MRFLLNYGHPLYQLNQATLRRHDKARNKIDNGPLWHMPRFTQIDAVVEVKHHPTPDLDVGY